MLARQGWRLLLNPDSLCAQVLRARYSSDLIDPMSGDWDRSLVNDVFLEEDAKYILSIPLKSGMEDSLAWHFDSKGEFSVKSAYHVLKDKNDLSQRRQVGEDSAISDHTCNFNWKKIWELQCQPKVKLFFWTLSHNSLPLRMNILRRGTRTLIHGALYVGG